MNTDLPWDTLTETHDYRTGKKQLDEKARCPECSRVVNLFDRKEDGLRVLAAHRLSGGGDYCEASRLILIGVTLSQCQAKLDEILEMLEGE